MELEFFDESFEQSKMYLPCGSIAYWDIDSGMSYRCELCGAVVGSIGQPQHCKDEMKKYENWAKLGGKDWRYFSKPEECK